MGGSCHFLTPKGKSVEDFFSVSSVTPPDPLKSLAVVASLSHSMTSSAYSRLLSLFLLALVISTSQAQSTTSSPIDCNVAEPGTACDDGNPGKVKEEERSHSLSSTFSLISLLSY